MTSRRTNRALSTTRRWTAGVLLATTLAAGGLGLHLADAYASTGTTTSASAATSTTSDTTSSTSSTSSGFGSTGSVNTSANGASTTTKGS